jgi:hypothetical protein
MLQEYLSLVDRVTVDKDSNVTQEKLKKSHLKVSELLLQILLKIDGVQCSTDLLKTKRKECVKFIQSQLDQADAAKSKVEDFFSQS